MKRWWHIQPDAVQRDNRLHFQFMGSDGAFYIDIEALRCAQRIWMTLLLCRVAFDRLIRPQEISGLQTSNTGFITLLRRSLQF